jgi:hypothetical protein
MQSACKCTEFNVLQQIAIIHPNIHRVMPLYHGLGTLFSECLNLPVGLIKAVPKVCPFAMLRFYHNRQANHHLP